MSEVNLELLPKDGERILKELAAGNMVITRSKNDFLYIVYFDDGFNMFSHTLGAPGGGRKVFPKDEKNTAMVRKIADVSDAVYMAEFDKSLNIFGVMYTAEDAILSMFPGDSKDTEGLIDFGIVNEVKDH